jgi:hypothetical protein
MSPDDLARILDELGRRLGPAGEHVFALAVRQQIIEGTLLGIGGLILVIVGVIVAIVARRNDYDNDGFIGWFGPGFCFLFGGVLLAAALSQLLNPEYAAIRDLLKAVR